MNWGKQLFKRIFCSQEEFCENYLPKVTNIYPMPKVKPCKPESNISEPVYAMQLSMSTRPHTWKIKRDRESEYAYEYERKEYKVKDIKTQLSFEVTKFGGYYGVIYRVDLSWLTKDEEQFLGTCLECLYDGKLAKVEGRRQVRKDIERDKIKRLYQ